MPFRLEYFEDEFVDSNYKKSLTELNKFFGFDWIHNIPLLFVVGNRLTFDKIENRKTEDWLVGLAINKNLFLLDRTKFDTEAKHSYSDEIYSYMIKHELCHLFFNKLADGYKKPKWLNEGVSIFLSGQNKFRQKPAEFKNFLDFYETYSNKDGSVYQESGFVLEFLIKKFGKRKLFNLIKPKFKTKKEFTDCFRKIYGFTLNYTNINKLYQQK